MNTPRFARLLVIPTLLATLTLLPPARAANSILLGWNNLGMHCMDSDYSVFSILPPYNTIEAQLIIGGKLVTSGAGYTVTYQAMADPAGSFNSTSAGKGNFYSFVAALYGASLLPDQGLAGWNMPGLANTPQSMLFETANQPVPGVFTPVNWFRAEGIPTIPYDDAMHKNTYPMMLLVARNSTGNVLGTSPIVLPVSDEMDCRACHGSGAPAAAQPAAGWVNNPNPERDYRLNILRLHDEHQFAQHPSVYSASLATHGFNPSGLFANVTADNKPILCATCHSSAALGTAGFPGVPPLTTSVHARHASVRDPVLNTTLDSANNRAACYRCHPGSTTKCLRGAMGTAVAADGSMLMQCQSCHGTMSQVGAANRLGWLMEPNCQSCHSGTALHNNGQIRYTSVFTDANGTVRQAVDQTFATTPNTPAAGLSLYRFSFGHGGLQCAACHGSTHAEFPTSEANDNVRNLQSQGHAGVMVECNACHATVPNTVSGGPHGMHPIGQSWVSRHGDLFENGGASQSQCRACHGLDYRGTVLSRAQANRSLTASENGATVKLFRGQLIGCYNCHNGPGGSSDSVSPTVKITLPTSSPSYSAGDSSISIGGSAADNAGVATVTWSNARGGSGIAVGTTSWTVEAVPLQLGVNVITVTAYDGSGKSGRDTLTVTYSTSGSLTVLTNGNGAINPNLNGRSLRTGTRVTLVARPAADNLFANWTGSILASTPSITFTFSSNMVIQANFVTNPFPALKGAYSGLFSDSGGVTHQGSGAFALNLTPAGAYSANLRAGGGSFAFAGRFDLSGESRVSIPRPRMASLAVDLHLDLANGTQQIAGTVSDGTWTSGLSAYRAAVQQQSCLYTVVIPGSPGDQVAGNGYGVAVVDKAGRVRFSAALADGTKFTQTATLSANGQWPLYAALYRGQGHVWSWMSITSGATDGLTGPLTWVKPNDPTAKYFPNGFTMDTTAWGSLYTPPSVGNTVLGSASGILTLTGGGLSRNITNYFVLGSHNTVRTTNSMSLAFTPANGLFYGRAYDSDARRWITFQGAVLQNPSIGNGYFLGDTQGGEVYLGPQ